MEKEKIDVQYSIFNGLNDYRGIEKFLIDLREVFIKHNIKYLRSDFMKMTEDDILVVRNSEFVGNKEVARSSENRNDIETNIIFDNKESKYKRAFEIVSKENEKYKKLADALKDILEMD